MYRGRLLRTHITATALGNEYNIFEAWLLSSPPLTSLESKHGRQLLNEIFIYSKDITPSPGYLKGWRIFKLTAVALGPTIFSRTRIQGFEET